MSGSNGHDIGRNQPCHCGSGLKFKRCHGAQQPSMTKPEPCVVGKGMGVECKKPAPEAQVCKLCHARFPYCADHEGDLGTIVTGHMICDHPELVPFEVAKMAQDRKLVAAIQQRAKEDPKQWKKLADALTAELAKPVTH
jgi:hypothetical protein